MSRIGYKENKNINWIRIILIVVFCTLLMVSAYKIIEWGKDNKANDEILDNIYEAIEVYEEATNTVENVDNNKNTNDYKVDFDKLKKQNKDTVAWLKVNNTEINYPVVQAKDNSYYINHNFNKKYNQAGWVFVDYKNKLDGTDKNIVIYGHNMKNNSMFGSLPDVLSKKWYNNKDNYIIDFVIEEKEYKYQVFSIYKIEIEDYYITTEFESDEFSQFIKIIKGRSYKNFKVDITNEDTILTLSTCGSTSNYRIVLHAKLIKEHND